MGAVIELTLVSGTSRTAVRDLQMATQQYILVGDEARLATAATVVVLVADRRLTLGDKYLPSRQLLARLADWGSVEVKGGAKHG